MAERILNIKESSNLRQAAYDADTQTLLVQFKSGHSGSYAGVNEDQALAFERADSPGSHLHNYIKPNSTYTANS